MTADPETDRWLIDRIRKSDADAWRELISRYEGRLYAFAESRLRDRSVSEDIVQETFIGFLNSLPNYDGQRALESYLFSICAYKLTDHLRREGRRPTVPLSGGSNSSADWELPAGSRGASAIAQSDERRGLEEKAIVAALADQIDRWRERGEWKKLMCAELLFVRGWANKDVATELGISEQQVANHKFDFIARMSKAIRDQGLNGDIFPELNSSG
jgi:RNA polymerase sigma-70 factor (ECF subfamily)